jgi:hypothetical protein
VAPEFRIHIKPKLAERVQEILREDTRERSIALADEFKVVSGGLGQPSFKP